MWPSVNLAHGVGVGEWGVLQIYSFGCRRTAVHTKSNVAVSEPGPWSGGWESGGYCRSIRLGAGEQLYTQNLMWPSVNLLAFSGQWKQQASASFLYNSNVNDNGVWALFPAAGEKYNLNSPMSQIPPRWTIFTCLVRKAILLVHLPTQEKWASSTERWMIFSDLGRILLTPVCSMALCMTARTVIVHLQKNLMMRRSGWISSHCMKPCRHHLSTGVSRVSDSNRTVITDVTDSVSIPRVTSYKLKCDYINMYMNGLVQYL